MPKQLGLLDADTAATAVVEARPSPPPQRNPSPHPTTPDVETSAAKPKAKGHTAHFHVESVATPKDRCLITKRGNHASISDGLS
jgi:hypothetical protein